MMNISQLARYLGVSRATVYGLIKAGALQPRRHANGRGVVTKSEVDRSLSELPATAPGRAPPIDVTSDPRNSKPSGWADAWWTRTNPAERMPLAQPGAGPGPVRVGRRRSAAGGGRACSAHADARSWSNGVVPLRDPDKR